jgi:hypothetical protein
MLWTKSRKLDFPHSITTLIPPLLPRYTGERMWLTEALNYSYYFLYNFSFKDAQILNLNFAFDLTKDWGSPHWGSRINHASLIKAFATSIKYKLGLSESLKGNIS